MTPSCGVSCIRLREHLIPTEKTYLFRSREDRNPDVSCQIPQPKVASNVTAVYRSDFFPGLGWMLLRSFWEEVKAPAFGANRPGVSQRLSRSKADHAR